MTSIGDYSDFYRDYERELCADLLWDNGILRPLARQVVQLASYMVRLKECSLLAGAVPFESLEFTNPRRRYVDANDVQNRNYKIVPHLDKSQDIYVLPDCNCHAYDRKTIQPFLNYPSVENTEVGSDGHFSPCISNEKLFDSLLIVKFNRQGPDFFEPRFDELGERLFEIYELKWSDFQRYAGKHKFGYFLNMPTNGFTQSKFFEGVCQRQIISDQQLRR